MLGLLIASGASALAPQCASALPWSVHVVGQVWWASPCAQRARMHPHACDCACACVCARRTCTRSPASHPSLSSLQLLRGSSTSMHIPSHPPPHASTHKHHRIQTRRHLCRGPPRPVCPPPAQSIPRRVQAAEVRLEGVRGMQQLALLRCAPTVKQPVNTHAQAKGRRQQGRQAARGQGQPVSGQRHRGRDAHLPCLQHMLPLKVCQL